MKYVIFTFEGNGFPIAKRLIDEGQDVLVGQVEDFTKTLTGFEKKAGLIEPPEEKKQRLKRYDHMLTKISADKLLEKLKKISDPENYFIFFDSNNLFYYAEQLQSLGFHGNFPTEEDREFEIDRDKAKEFVKKYYPHLAIASKRTFRKISEAKKFLKASKSIWVLKSQTDMLPTFVPETNNVGLAKAQILETLEVFRRGYEESGFLLEKRIDSLIEVTPEKYYYNGTALGMDINIENKFIGSGNISMQVGCAGDLIIPISMKSKIHDIAFPPIVDKLAKQHKGLFLWDASLLIDEKTGEIYFGEFCPNRPGYNSIFTLLEQASSVHEFFEKCTKKEEPFSLGTVGASLMTFNILRGKDDELLPDATIDITASAAPHVWGYDFYKKTPSDYTRTVGYDLHLAPITGSEKNITKAVDMLYAHLEGFTATRAYYRPRFDFLSTDYPSSIMNRLHYCLKKGLFTLSFPL